MTILQRIVRHLARQVDLLVIPVSEIQIILSSNNCMLPEASDEEWNRLEGKLDLIQTIKDYNPI